MSKPPTKPGLVPAPANTPVETVAQRIYVIRNERVMLDSALADLYQVPTFRLNEAVKRNKKRFRKTSCFI